MRPISLKLDAFGSYGKETLIDFTKPTQNLFLITGDTGSGKSTIFDAIVYALYGVGKENELEYNLYDLVRTKTVYNKRCSETGGSYYGKTSKDDRRINQRR